MAVDINDTTFKSSVKLYHNLSNFLKAWHLYIVQVPHVLKYKLYNRIIISGSGYTLLN